MKAPARILRCISQQRYLTLAFARDCKRQIVVVSHVGKDGGMGYLQLTMMSSTRVQIPLVVSLNRN